MITTYKGANAISVNWLFFSWNKHETQPVGLLIDNYTTSMDMVDPHVKSFLNLNCYEEQQKILYQYMHMELKIMYLE